MLIYSLAYDQTRIRVTIIPSPIGNQYQITREESGEIVDTCYAWNRRAAIAEADSQFVTHCCQ